MFLQPFLENNICQFKIGIAISVLNKKIEVMII